MTSRDHLLRTHRVILREDLADNHTIEFVCMAEDKAHAKEQAINAYPTGKVLAVVDLG